MFLRPKSVENCGAFFGATYAAADKSTGFQVGPTFPIFPFFFDLLLLFPTFS